MYPQKFPNSIVVKSTARACLKGKTVQAAVAGLAAVFSLCTLFLLFGAFVQAAKGAFSVFAVLFAAIMFIFVCSPIILGTIRYFWRLTDGADDSPTEVFYYFSGGFLYRRAVKFALLMLYKIFTAILTCMLPFLLVALISNAWIYQFLGTEIPLWVTRMALVQSFLYTVGILASILVISRYYLFPAITVMDDDMLLLEAVHISVMVSGRTVSAFLGVLVSLFGWILLSLLAAPAIYTVPYILCCYVVHSRYALVNYNLSMDYYCNAQYTGG